MSASGSERAAELLKTLHGHRISAREIMAHTGWSEKVVYRWCNEWVAHGILSCELAAEPCANGTRQKLYSLAKKWGG